MSLHSIWCGPCFYKEGQLIQSDYLQKIQLRSQLDSQMTSELGTILGFEFQPVVTLGRRSIDSEDLVAEPQQIRKKGFDLIQVDRGGQATLHSPGQLVIYPVIDLQSLKMGVKDYICWLTRVSRQFFAQHGIATFERPQEPGLFTDKGKIAFFGVRIVEGITQHGVALNIKNDLDVFSMIRSCGIKDEKFDCLLNANESIDKTIDLRDLFFQWVKNAQQLLKEDLLSPEVSPISSQIPSQNPVISNVEEFTSRSPYLF